MMASASVGLASGRVAGAACGGRQRAGRTREKQNVRLPRPLGRVRGDPSMGGDERRRPDGLPRRPAAASSAGAPTRGAPARRTRSRSRPSEFDKTWTEIDGTGWPNLNDCANGSSARPRPDLHVRRSRTTRTRRRSSARRATMPYPYNDITDPLDLLAQQGRKQLGDDEPADAKALDKKDKQRVTRARSRGARRRSSPVRAAASDGAIALRLAGGGCRGRAVGARCRRAPYGRARRSPRAAAARARSPSTSPTPPRSARAADRASRPWRRSTHAREQRRRGAAQARRSRSPTRSGARVMAVNLDGTFYVTRAFLAELTRGRAASSTSRRSRGPRGNSAARGVLRRKAWGGRTHAGACRGTTRC